MTSCRPPKCPLPTKAAASHLPDWSQFATKTDLARLESRLVRWMTGVFIAGLGVADGLVSLVLAALR